MKTQTCKTAAVMGLISRGPASALVTAGRAVSNLDTGIAGREQLRYIHIEHILPDERNFYELSDIDELAASIEFAGLQQPLRVRPGEEEGSYVIVSGHRRHAALKQLSAESQEGYERYSQVPCIVERPSGCSSEVEAMLQELRLIYGNSGTRRMSPAETSRQAERVETLLYQLKEAGVEFPGRMRDHVAEACRVSAPKLARLKVIREGLVPAYMDLFQSDKLPESAAYALARLPEEMQYRVLRACPEPPAGVYLELIHKKYQEGWRWDPNLICPDGTACNGGDRFLRHDCENYCNPCGGKTCCLECSEANRSNCSCNRMCAKAKAQRKERANETKTARVERLAENGRKYQEQTEINAQRLAPLLTAAGLEGSETISWRGYRPGIKVSTILEWAGGVFDDPANWTEAELDPQIGDSRNMAKLAKRLDCSTDYLLGLTDDPRTVETVDREEEVVVQDSMEKFAKQVDTWDDLAQMLDCVAEPDLAVRRICWEDSGRPPLENALILTYQLTNNGPQYRPAIWDGSKFTSPDHRRELTGLQYTHWLEIPVPASGVVCEISTLPGDQPGTNSWMPGDANPTENSEVVAEWDLGDGGPLFRSLGWFDGVDIRLGNGGMKPDGKVVRWFQLPPVGKNVFELDTDGADVDD